MFHSGSFIFFCPPGSVSFSGTNVNIHCSEPGADLKKGEETFGNSRLTPYQDSDPAKLYHCMRTLDENGDQVEDPEKYLAFYIKAKGTHYLLLEGAKVTLLMISF